MHTSPATVKVVVYRPLYYTILPPPLITLIMKLFGCAGTYYYDNCKSDKSCNYNIITIINRRFFLFSNSSCQFVVEQHAATRRHEIGEHDGFHYEGLRMSDDSQPVHIYRQQFGAIGLWKRQQAQMNEQASFGSLTILYTRKHTTTTT